MRRGNPERSLTLYNHTMTNEHKIALLPLDNRPVSYLLPKQIADFSGVKLTLPERKYLGDLKQGSDLDYLENWLMKEDSFPETSLLVSLDNWVYGGLVQSRKHAFNLDFLKKRVELLKKMKTTSKYGFSTIMRIPYYNDSSEDKDYWGEYGEKIFKWSELMHKVGRGIKNDTESHEELLENWYQSSKLIPAAILADYKSHRDKNLSVNLLWLESLHENCFEYLIFSCDDSGKYGMNVIEAEYITKQITSHNHFKNCRVISGTDEIPLVLMTKSVVEACHGMPLLPGVHVYFNDEKGKNEIARYESNTIDNSLSNQLEILALERKDYKDSDIVLYIHTANSIQGEHVFGLVPENTETNTNKLVRLIEACDKPFIVIDLAYANGADPVFVEALLQSKINWNNCYGFSAWNTCSNSTGSALAIGVNRWISEKRNAFNEYEFKKCLFVRFLDDYAYQAKIRHKNITEAEVNEKIKPYIKTFSRLFRLDDINVKCKLPWNRSFEIEIEI